MNPIRHLLATIAIAGVLALQLSGCARNPATGASTFTGGLSEAEEIRMGEQNHPKIVAEFGGEYGTADLRSYVSSIGRLLARTSERPQLKWRFTVLNSDIVNAFATPGGYVYITRGLLALADNEAQLAGVLAHEIGHITALHHARRHGQSLLAQAGIAAAGILGGQAAAEMGQFGAVSLLQSYSREHEYESDQLGIRYLARAGYDPAAMAGFLEKLRASSRLDARRRGQSPDKIDQFNYLATHPAPLARVNRATRLAREVNVKDPMTARDIYLSKIDGILYGDDPAQGYIRNRDFLHPTLGFAFRVPPGFTLFNSPAAVYAIGPGDSRIVFDRAEKRFKGTMKRYVAGAWGRQARLRNLEAIKVNGLDAATATTQLRNSRGTVDVRLIAYRMDRDTIYRFVFATPPGQTSRLSADLRRTTYSFRRLGRAEAEKLRPLVVRLVTVGRGDTVSGLSRRLPYSDFRIERFEVLNGLSRNDPLRIGRKVKIIAEK